MKHKSILFGFFLLIQNCEKKDSKPFDPLSQNEKNIYALGQIYAKRISYLQLTKEELQVAIEGIKANHAQNDKALAAEEVSVQDFISQRQKILADENERKKDTFLEQFKKDGGTILTNGLGYKIVAQGNSTKPDLNSTVEVEYKGQLLNGTVFDETKGQSVTIPLRSVIPGWQSGLTFIGEGGTIRLVIPADLAYGKEGMPPQIPPGATLDFTVTIKKVNL